MVMFQSTRPARGATLRDFIIEEHGVEFQSTRPARGATSITGFVRAMMFVSIHAPRTGRDMADNGTGRILYVSIHAPRTGRDTSSVRVGARTIRFNPRAPHGARRRLGKCAGYPFRFQSTRPARGATRG